MSDFCKIGSYNSLDDMPMQQGFEIAFLGRSNVGKSSLLNNLLGRKKLAPVSGQPGKTHRINLYKGPEGFFLVDLPGYGFAKVSEKIKASWAAHLSKFLANRPQQLVLLFDIRRDPRQDDLDFLQWMQEKDKTPILVLTKADKLSKSKRAKRYRELQQSFGDLVGEVVLYSTIEPLGKNELWGLLKKQKAAWDS